MRCPRIQPGKGTIPARYPLDSRGEVQDVACKRLFWQQLAGTHVNVLGASMIRLIVIGPLVHPSSRQTLSEGCSGEPSVPWLVRVLPQERSCDVHSWIDESAAFIGNCTAAPCAGDWAFRGGNEISFHVGGQTVPSQRAFELVDDKIAHIDCQGPC